MLANAPCMLEPFTSIYVHAHPCRECLVRSSEKPPRATQRVEGDGCNFPYDPSGPVCAVRAAARAPGGGGVIPSRASIGCALACRHARHARQPTGYGYAMCRLSSVCR